MIVFKPDQKCRKRFKDKVDFDTLALVYSILYDTLYKGQKKRNFTISIYTTAGLYSYYRWQKGSNVRINISELIFDVKTFHRALIHEFRHFLQDKIFKLPLTKKNYDDSTLQKYAASPVEIDADNYEAFVLPKAMRLYNRLLRAKVTIGKVSDYKGN